MWSQPMYGARDISNCRTPLYAHIWRSLMLSILSSYLGMPIFGHIVVINTYDLIKHWRSIHKDYYTIWPIRARSYVRVLAPSEQEAL